MKENVPKNIRLVGDKPEGTTVFLEDYVSTYLKGELGEEAAILVGRSELEEEVRIYVSGAISCPSLSIEQESLSISIKMWNYIYQEMKRSFPGQEIVGWYIPLPEVLPDNYKEQIQILQSTDFSRDDMVLCAMRRKNGEAYFCTQKNGKLARLEGFYIYYEKNEPMRDYIMLKREEKQLEEDLRAEQMEENRVVMRYRDYINSERNREMRKRVQKGEKINSGLAYAMCVVALVFMFVLSIGIVAGYQQVNTVDEAMTQLGKELHIDEKEDAIPANGYYVVKEGDSLESISISIYNNEDMVEEICRINQIADPEAIYVGQKLLLP